MTRGIHTIVPRRPRRPGVRGAHAAVPAAGHDARPVRAARRTSAVVAAALTTVALTTTAAVSLTGPEGSGASTTTAPAEPTSRPSALAADPAVRSAAQKADAVLSDADYVTREGDLTAKETKQVKAVAHDLRVLLHESDETTGSVVATRQPTAASRSTERSPLADRAHEAAASPTAAPTSTGLPVLETPLSSTVDTAPETEAGGDSATEQAEEAPSAERIEKKTTSLQRIITRADADAVVSVKAGPTPEEIAQAREARASRAAERAKAEKQEKAAARAAEVKEMARAAQSHGNGQIPSSVLCDVGWAAGEQLRCDAAAALDDLNRDFRAEFGRNLDVTDAYRSYAEQVTVSATRGGLAAVPGTSNHGWGQALDLSGGIESFGSAEHGWMVANAGKHGWKLPAWAQAGGSKPEAWHWEYGTSY